MADPPLLQCTPSLHAVIQLCCTASSSSRNQSTDLQVLNQNNYDGRWATHTAAYVDCGSAAAVIDGWTVKSRKHRGRTFHANNSSLRCCTAKKQPNSISRVRSIQICLAGRLQPHKTQQQQLCRSLMCVQRAASKDATVAIQANSLVLTPRLALTVTLVLIPDELVSHWIDSYNNLLICSSHSAHSHVHAASHHQCDESGDAQAVTWCLFNWEHHQQQQHVCFMSDPKLFISNSNMKPREDQRCNRSKLAMTFVSVKISSHEENELFLSCGLRLHVKSRMRKCFCQYPLNMHFDY